MQFYNKEDSQQQELDENSIFIINNENSGEEEESESNNELELKQEFFNKWKEGKKMNEHDENIEEKLNEDDCDEDVSDKLYIISMDGIPYYYENDLVSARSKMWTIANNLLRKDSSSSSVHDIENNTNYIFTNNLNKVSLISPYNFFGLNYHHTICELQIDYVVRYNN